MATQAIPAGTRITSAMVTLVSGAAEPAACHDAAAVVGRGASVDLRQGEVVTGYDISHVGFSQVIGSSPIPPPLPC